MGKYNDILLKTEGEMMSRRNKPQVLKATEVEKAIEEANTEVVTEEVLTEVVGEAVVDSEVPKEEEEAEVIEPEVVTASAGGVEVESKNLSQEQADKLACSLKSAQEKQQDNILLEKQKGAVRQYAFGIYNSMIMAGVAFGSETNRKKFILLSIDTAKDFIKHSKDIDMDGIL